MLGSVGCEVSYCKPERAAIQAELGRGPGLFVIDARAQQETIRWLLGLLTANHRKSRYLFISGEANHEFIRELLNEDGVDHLIAGFGGLTHSAPRPDRACRLCPHRAVIDEKEMIVTCNKLFSGDLFGIEKYLSTWGVQVHEHIVRSIADKQEAIAALGAFLERISCNEVASAQILNAADELLMNAIFNAPINEQGKPKYVDTDRRTMLQLEENEHVDLHYGCDGRHLALAVRDQFGSLTRERLTRYLRSCFSSEPVKMEEKRQGGGLGLHMVFNAMNRLVFNICEGVGTEVIAQFPVGDNAGVAELCGHSLNVFFVQK